MKDSLENLLESKGIKVTANRLIVLRAISECKGAVTMAELEDMVDSIDKSGIFRTLMLFEQNHLLHAIDDGCHGTRYELCRASGHIDDDRHVHFHCEKCHRTICLDDMSVPVVDLPQGYQAESVNYMIKGVCPNCINK